MENDWIFIKKNNGWFLKIRTLEEYFRYREETDSEHYGKIIEDMISVTKGKHEQNPATTCILMGLTNQEIKGKKNKKSALELVSDLSEDVASWQIDCLMKGYYLLFNRVGGCHFDNSEGDYQWCRKKEIVFPDFKDSDISIKRFIDGEHYYAYIGNTQVRDGDILKWTTYEDAYRQAKTYII